MNKVIKGISTCLCMGLAFCFAGCDKDTTARKTTTKKETTKISTSAKSSSKKTSKKTSTKLSTTRAHTTTESREKIIVGACDDFKPFEYLDTNNTLTGIDIELIRAYGEWADVDIEIRNMNWDALMSAMNKGELDAAISAIPITDERKEMMNFTKPYYSANLAFVVSQLFPNVLVETEAEVLNELKNKKVAYQTGTTTPRSYIHGDDDYPGIEEVHCADFVTISEGFSKLGSGVDAFIMDETPAIILVENYYDRLFVLEPKVKVGEYAIGVNKSNTELLESLNQFLDVYMDSDEYKDLIYRYYE